MKVLFILLTVLGLLSTTKGQCGSDNCYDCLAGCAMGADNDCAIQDCTAYRDGVCDDPWGMACGYFISICCADGICCGNLWDIPDFTICYDLDFNICHAVVCLFDLCDDLPDWLEDLFEFLFGSGSGSDSSDSDSDSDDDDDDSRRRLLQAEMKKKLTSGDGIDELFLMIAEKQQKQGGRRLGDGQETSETDLVAWKYTLQVIKDALANGATRSEAKAKAQEMYNELKNN